MCVREIDIEKKKKEGMRTTDKGDVDAGEDRVLLEEDIVLRPRPIVNDRLRADWLL